MRRGLVLLAAIVVLGFLVVGLVLSRVKFTGTSDAELTTLVRNVPVPATVTSVPPEVHETVNTGLAHHYRLVNLKFATDLSCDALMTAWEGILQAKGRHFVKSDTTGPVLSLKLTDTPVPVSVILGNRNDARIGCRMPIVATSGIPYTGL